VTSIVWVTTFVIAEPPVGFGTLPTPLRTTVPCLIAVGEAPLSVQPDTEVAKEHLETLQLMQVDEDVQLDVDEGDCCELGTLVNHAVANGTVVLFAELVVS
jgi:hypothetical protein